MLLPEDRSVRMDPPDDVLAITLTVGGPGSGKTVSSVPKYIYAAAEHLAAVVQMDRHAHMIRETIRLATQRGLSKKLVVDQYSNFDRVLPCVTMQRSNHPNILKRKAFDEVTVFGWLDLLYSMADRGKGDEKSIHSMPSLSEATRYATRILLHQPRPVSPAEFRTLSQLRSRKCRELVDACEDDEAKGFWSDLIRYAFDAKDKIIDEKAGAFFRLASQALSEAFIVRCADTTPLLELILEKKLILFDASDDGSVHARTATGLFRATNLTIFNLLMRHYIETHFAANTILVWEEAAAMNIPGPVETNIYREGRKTGLFPHTLTQDLVFVSDEVIQTILGCARRKEWYNPMNPDLAMEAAKDIAYPQLDPDEIALEQESVQQLHAGFDYETRVGKTTSKQLHPDGKHRKTEGETVTEVAVPIYERVVNKRVQLRSLDDQVKLKARSLLLMPPGYRMVKQTTSKGTTVDAQPQQAPLLEDLYPEDEYPGLAEKKIAKAIIESQAQSCFITPVEPAIIVEAPWKPTVPVTAPKLNGQPINGHQPNGKKLPPQTNGKPRKKVLAPSLMRQ